MLNQRTVQTAYLERVVEGILLFAAFALAFQLRRSVTLPFVGDPVSVDLASHVWLLAIAVPLFWALARRGNGPTRSSVLGSFRNLVVAFTYLGLILGTAIFLFQAKTFSRAVFFMFLAFGFALTASARLLLHSLPHRRRSTSESSKRVLIIGLSQDALAFRRRIEARTEYDLEVVGHLAGPRESLLTDREAILGSIEDLKHIVEDQVVDHVVFVVSFAELAQCEPHIAWCDEVGVTVHLKADFIRSLASKTYPSEVDGIPILTLASTPGDAGALLAKQALDLGGSAIALILLFPLMIAVSILIKATSRGPIFFSQERVGLNGRVFRLFKFRSMYEDAEERKTDCLGLNEMDGPVFKIGDDPRVTPPGKWLRKFSLDELPQLWNVLRGDMSLVGPRPPLADEVKQYERWQRRRLSMKPGITCLWQVNGRNNIAFEDWMRLDLEYIDNWSLALDVKILLRTFPAVVMARGSR